MKNKILEVSLWVLLIIAFFSYKAEGTIYYSRITGNWNNASTWSTVACNGAANTGTFPNTVMDTVIICHPIILNTSVNVNSVSIQNAGVLDFETTTLRSLSVSGNVTIDNGGFLRYVGNSGLAHSLFIGRDFINNGNTLLYTDNNDYVDIIFSGPSNSVVSGTGPGWSLHSIVLNKSLSTAVLESQTTLFYSNFNGGYWTFTRGIYHHNNTATFNIPSATNDLTIGPDATINCSAGTLNLSYAGNILYLEGKLQVSGGTVNIGRSAAAAPNGIRYTSIGGHVPELIVSAGTLNVFQGIMYASSATHPFSVTISGGTINLNTGTNSTNASVFYMNDVGGSSFVMSNGTIVIQKKSSGGFPDFHVCGANGSVTSTGGTVQFGNALSTAQTFTFTPFANSILPNFRITGTTPTAITLHPHVPGDFQLLSLYIDQGKFFDISHNNIATDNRTMTLTGTYDGVHSFYDNNNELNDHFLYRNSTLEVHGSSSVKANDFGVYVPRFYNFSCAEPGEVTRAVLPGFGITNVVTVNGGTFTSDSPAAIFLLGENPLSIIPGSSITVDFLAFGREGQQYIPGYTYDCRIVIAQDNTVVNQTGDVTCNYLYVNGDWFNGRSLIYNTDNYDLTVLQSVYVGLTGDNTVKSLNLAGSSVYINNLEIENGGEINAGGSFINISGNWNNTTNVANSFNCGTSTVSFIGTGNQQLNKNTLPEVFYNLQMNKSSGNLSLGTPVNIINNITFTSGNVITTAADLLVISADATTSGASPASFADGPVRRYGVGAFTFPTGKGAVFGPVGIAPAGMATDAFTAEYFNADPHPLHSVNNKNIWMDTISRCEYWTLTRDVGNANTKVTLGYGAASCDKNEYSKFSVTGWTGTQWSDYGRGAGSNGDNATGMVESCGEVSIFGEFTLAVSEAPSPEISADGPVAFCEGDSVALTSTDGVSYLWSTGETTKSIIVKWGDSYSVTVFDGGGCGVTSSPLNVTVHALPDPPTGFNGTICGGTGTVILSASGSPATYNWYEDSSGGISLSGSNNYTTPVLTSTTTYYVASVSAEGCESKPRTPVLANVYATAPGDTSVPGDNIWNVYAFNNNNYTDYKGYYTEPLLSFDSETRWDKATSPSSASGYQGCEVANESFAVFCSRTNFTPGYYQIDIVKHDDDCHLYINNDLIFYDDYSDNGHGNVWTGYLDNTSVVKFKWLERGGDSYAELRFTSIANPNDLVPGSISESQTICSTGDPSSIGLSQYSPIDDSFVRGTSLYENQNYGSADLIRCKDNTVPADHRIAYLKFNLSGQNFPVNSAILKLRGDMNGSRTNIPISIYAVSDTTWDEMTIAYVNKPSRGALLDTDTIPDDLSRDYYWDITDYLNTELAAGRSLISLSLESPLLGNLVEFNSKENNEYPPLLLINHAISSCYITYQWQESQGCTGTWTNIPGATTTEYDPPSSPVQTTCYRLLANDACGNYAESNSVTITVGTLSKAGNINSVDTVCAGNNSGVLKLSGYTGNSITWEVSTDSFATAAASFNINIDSIAYVNISSDHYYRVIVVKDGCAADTSTVTKITARQLPAPSASDSSRCSSGDVLLAASGSPADYVWYEEATGGFSIGSGSTYLVTGLTDTVSYFVASTDALGCESLNRTEVKALIHALPLIPVTQDTSICKNSSVELTANGSPSGYKWYDALTEGTLIATTPSYTQTYSSDTDVYVSSVDDNGCESSRALINVIVSDSSNGGIITAPPTVCTGSDGSISLSGYKGEIVGWQYSDDNFNSNIIDVSATTAVVSFNNISNERWYRALVKNEACPVTYSDTLYLEIEALSVGGFTGGSDTVCLGNNSGSIHLSGYTGSIVKWEYSTDNFGSTLNTISSTASAVDFNNLNDNTFYRAVVKNGVCPESYSSVSMINVAIDTAFNSGTLGMDTLVVGGNNSGIVTLTGNSGNIEHWEYSTDGFSTFNILSHTDPVYNYLDLTRSTSFRVITSGTYCQHTSDTMSVAINYLAQIVVDTIYAIKNRPYSAINSILDNDRDVENDILEIAPLLNYITLSGGLLSLDKEGMVQFVPTEDFLGLDSVEYTICTPGLPSHYCVIGKLYILVEPPQDLMIYPTISPNNDGYNDTWIIDNIHKFPNNKVVIYNRWGDIVYKENGYDNITRLWSGNSNRGLSISKDQLPEGTYFYRLDLGNGSKELTGYVVLKR